MEALIQNLNGIVWGLPMLALLLLTGFFLTVGLKGLSIIRVPYGFKQVFKKRNHNADEGDVSPFAALMTALSSTIGTGNIAGVAAAIAIGGPGAVFWMWMTAILGTATKFSEGVLAVRYREIDSYGNRVGGPMYYIKNGLGKKWIPLAFIFAFFGFFAALGTGAAIQSNSVSDVLNSSYGVSPWVTAFILAGLAAAVIIGGVKRIGSVASKVVPVMALFYVAAGLTVIFLNIGRVPDAFAMIFKGAFGLQSATTGITIALMLHAMQKGVARGIFSNEAGQGSAPIAHAAAQNNDPVNQGVVAMLGTIIDTLIVCTITALVILTSGAFGEQCLPSPETLADIIDGDLAKGCMTSAPLTAASFEAGIGVIGKHIVSIGLAVFAFTTIIGWSYYGERCSGFLFGEKFRNLYRILWILVVFAAAAVITLQKRIFSIGEQKLSFSDDGEVLVDGKLLINNGEPVTTVFDKFGGEVSAQNADLKVVDGIVMIDGAVAQIDGPVANIVNLFWLMADTLTGISRRQIISRGRRSFHFGSILVLCCSSLPLSCIGSEIIPMTP